MTVKEEIEAQVALLRKKADALEAHLAAMPSEVHHLSAEAWARIKAFLGFPPPPDAVSAPAPDAPPPPPPAS